ncbi:MAG: DUF6288 domain-containing protein [Akkermansiaceae bacterium]|nr:DUF6288 domain-containing protein [Akkermansiaceae bacterium]
MKASTIKATLIASCGALIAASLGSLAKADPYYADKSGMKLFNPYPKTEGRGSGSWTVRYFGPVGIGIELVRPGMTMKIKNVEEGSPADQTGKLKKGQIIESINGTVLKDIDPRFILGDLITQAEATDGKINLKIQGEGVVTVQIPVMGSYSPTWPVNCDKSDKIVRKLADLLAEQEKPKWGSVIFLLSTGEEKDLEVVRKWMKNADEIYGNMNWATGYNGLGLCEYYLRTGDKSVLPVIKRLSEQLKDNLYSGGWSGRGAPAAFTYSVGSGQVHASGVNCMSFLMMAKLCGVEVDDYMMKSAWKQFYRYAGHGNVAYGNTYPEGGFRDNGKTSGLAYALGAAALLHPDGENTTYARARDNSAMKAFYATNWFHAAHTGGGMGEIWHHTAMHQVREKRPQQFRSYFDTRRWVMELSRRWDGSIAIAGMDDRYNRSATDCSGDRAWGTFFALTYTLHRKQLQIFGAPRSPHAKSEAIPIPWGNEADEIYHSIEPIPGGPLTMQDLLNETVENGSSVPFLSYVSDENVTDETLMKYLHHPEYGYREATMRDVVQKGRFHLVLPLLRHTDTRLRQCGLLAITGMFKGRAMPQDQITPEMWEEVSKMVMDKDEAWWTALYAVKAMARADQAFIGKHRDRLLEFLTYYDSPWLETDAHLALSKIAVEPEHYKVLLPVLLEKTSKFRVDNASFQSARAITDALKGASPEIKEFAAPLVKTTYTSIPEVVTEPHTGAVFGRGAKVIRSRIGMIAQSVPGGEDFVRQQPKTTLESYKSGKASDEYRYSGKFEPNPEVIGTWEWCVWPAANKPEEINPKIDAWIKNQTKGGKSLPRKLERPKDTLVIKDNGKVEKSKFYRGYFWSGNRLIGIDDSQALKMAVVNLGGRDFLVVERGGFNKTPETEEEATSGVPADYHCGYHIYMRRQ